MFLPEDLHAHVLTYLDLLDFARTATVSKSWHSSLLPFLSPLVAGGGSSAVQQLINTLKRDMGFRTLLSKQSRHALKSALLRPSPAHSLLLILHPPLLSLWKQKQLLLKERIHLVSSVYRVGSLAVSAVLVLYLRYALRHDADADGGFYLPVDLSWRRMAALRPTKMVSRHWKLLLYGSVMSMLHAYQDEQPLPLSSSTSSPFPLSSPSALLSGLLLAPSSTLSSLWSWCSSSLLPHGHALLYSTNDVLDAVRSILLSQLVGPGTWICLLQLWSRLFRYYVLWDTVRALLQRVVLPLLHMGAAAAAAAGGVGHRLNVQLLYVITRAVVLGSMAVFRPTVLPSAVCWLRDRLVLPLYSRLCLHGCRLPVRDRTGTVRSINPLRLDANEWAQLLPPTAYRTVTVTATAAVATATARGGGWVHRLSGWCRRRVRLLVRWMRQAVHDQEFWTGIATDRSPSVSSIKLLSVALLVSHVYYADHPVPRHYRLWPTVPPRPHDDDGEVNLEQLLHAWFLGIYFQRVALNRSLWEAVALHALLNISSTTAAALFRRIRMRWVHARKQAALQQ